VSSRSDATPVMMMLVGRVPRAELEGGALVRLPYPPFDVLVAIVGGAPVAIEDACNHAGASLSEGERHGDCVACPMHGYVFEMATGRLVQPRGLCPDQRTFVARFEGDSVVVWDPGAGISIIGP
jgi:nitrite reductase/ring-hydroxylating ferredoxin subunit